MKSQIQLVPKKNHTKNQIERLKKGHNIKGI